MALAVLAAHGLGVWYGNSISLTSDAKPQKNTLAIEIVRPPEAAAEARTAAATARKAPPKAPPPIQTAAVVPSEVPVAAPWRPWPRSRQPSLLHRRRPSR